jgi:DNA polymerase-3 subunit alpha
MTLGAVVTAIKRQVSRKSGSEFARLTVEDFSGSSEVLVFPEAWSALSDRVRTDVPMLIKGGYSRRDQGGENPTFIVEGIQRFEELRVSGQVAVAIEIGASEAASHGQQANGGADSLDSGVFHDVRAVIESHPGFAPLHVRWSDSSGNVARLRSRSLKLAASHAALTELRALLGQERVRLVRGGGS